MIIRNRNSNSYTYEKQEFDTSIFWLNVLDTWHCSELYNVCESRVAYISVLCDLLYWSDTDCFFLSVRKDKEWLANILDFASLSFSFYLFKGLVPSNGELVRT